MVCRVLLGRGVAGRPTRDLAATWCWQPLFVVVLGVSVDQRELRCASGRGEGGALERTRGSNCGLRTVDCLPWWCIALYQRVLRCAAACAKVPLGVVRGALGLCREAPPGGDS